jgi:YXWGXW repeat-containing protein
MLKARGVIRLAWCGLAAAAMACASAPPRRVVYVVKAPPGDVVEVVPAQPGAGYVWIRGHYRWDGDDYRWVPGHWGIVPTGYREWVPGHWAERHDQWFWVEGHWR